MKSVKPGRAPSAIGAWGAVVAVVFGIFWIFMTARMGAPVIFPVFGLLFVITGVIIGVYHFKNATGRNRYSTFDITEDGEETDPLNARFSAPPPDDGDRDGASAFCPYCGAPAETQYAFCRNCVKRLPE